ncbi:MAG: FtsX-like permease family protein [Bacteroidota bacterium]
MIQNYFKIAFRNLKGNKIFSLINIAGLALGIAGSIVIFQLVKYHLSMDSYHKNANNIYRVVMNLHLGDGSTEYEKGSPFILHNTLKNDFASVSNVAYIGKQELVISIAKDNGIVDKYLEKESAIFTNSGYFDLFDYQWLVGKAESLNIPNAIILTEKFAKKYFGDTNPIDKTLKINNLQSLKVVGLLKNYPENTDFKTDVFISLPTLKTIVPDYGYNDWYWFSSTRETFISLQNNVSKEDFEKQFPAFSKKYFGQDAKVFQFHLQALSDVHFNLNYGGKIKKSTIILLSFIGLLLILIACINFINLSTAQSFKRVKEIGVRKVLGSSQRQLFWQFITEITIITIIAISFALLLGYMAIPTLNSWLKTEINFFQFFDTKLLIFMPLLLIFIIVIAGIYPSYIISNYNPIKALKGNNQGLVKGISLRKALVTTQFCISFVLIAVSILVVFQIDFLRNKDIGLNKDLIIHVNLPNNEKSVLTTLKNQLSEKSYIKNISFERSAPCSKFGGGGQIKFENREWEKFAVRSRIADENYLDTYQIKLVTGRKPMVCDTVREILVNEKLVKNLGLKTPEEIINKRLLIGDSGQTGTIVGVVADFNNADLYTKIEPTVIFSLMNRYKQVAIKFNSFDSDKTIQDILKTWEKLFPNEVMEYSFYDQELTQFYEREDLIRNLTISFALLSIFISCLGLFGLVSFTITQRTKEIGIRKVLGASVNQIVTLLSKEFLKLVLISFIIAIPLAWWAMDKWLQDFAYRIEIGWWMFAFSAGFSLLITLLTVSYQAIKAAIENPVKSLRAE